MPTQGDVFIGVIVDNQKDAEDVFASITNKKCDDIDNETIPISIQYNKKTYKTSIQYLDNGETDFPGIIGIELTSRYSPSIIDDGMLNCENGKYWMFVLDLMGINDILNQMKMLYPGIDWKPILMDNFY